MFHSISQYMTMTDLKAMKESFILDIDPSVLSDSVTVDDPGQATVMIVDDDGT